MLHHCAHSILLHVHKALTLFQQPLISLHGSCVQHCKLQKLHAWLLPGVIYTCFHKERSIFHTFSSKTSHVLAVGTVYDVAIASMFAARHKHIVSATVSIDTICFEKVQMKRELQNFLVLGTRKIWCEIQCVLSSIFRRPFMHTILLGSHLYRSFSD